MGSAHRGALWRLAAISDALKHTFKHPNTSPPAPRDPCPTSTRSAACGPSAFVTNVAAQMPRQPRVQYLENKTQRMTRMTRINEKSNRTSDPKMIHFFRDQKILFFCKFAKRWVELDFCGVKKVIEITYLDVLRGPFVD